MNQTKEKEGFIVYLTEDEKNILKSQSEKFKVSMNSYTRTIIRNSKHLDELVMKSQLETK